MKPLTEFLTRICKQHNTDDATPGQEAVNQKLASQWEPTAAPRMNFFCFKDTLKKKKKFSLDFH